MKAVMFLVRLAFVPVFIIIFALLMLLLLIVAIASEPKNIKSLNAALFVFLWAFCEDCWGFVTKCKFGSKTESLMAQGVNDGNSR